MKGIYLLSLLVLLTSCDIFDKEEDIPGFVAITAANLQTTIDQGANTSNIVDATVFANSVFVGTFELPATIPIMQTGPVELQIAAGIKNNGLTNDRQIYPFYDFYKKEITVIPDATVPISSDSTITFKYFDNGIKYVIEDFEQTGITLIPTGINNAVLTQISSPPRNVKTFTSLQAVLPADSGKFNVITQWNLHDLPKGNNMYLEIDFKGTVPLELGIVTLDPAVHFVFALGLVPKDNYTKIYVDLTDEISQQISTNHFEIFLNAQSSNSSANDSIFIDNLKFVYP